MPENTQENINLSQSDSRPTTGFAVENDEWRCAHLFGVRMPASIDLAALHADLQRANVAAALRGSALRVAPNVYNDGADVEALMNVLRISVGTSAVRP